MNALYLYSRNFDPFYNLAVEEYVLGHLPENDLVFFIWQSDSAVIIGRHQNPWKETHTGFIAQKHVALARRISGGGAVYQDLGNLNFSFIAGREHFDQDRQLRTVCESLLPYNIQAAIGNRKELRAFGKKFSGSAFSYKHNRALHHGTLLVNTDLSMMKALAGNMRIVNHQGTGSEHSEMINLGAINPDISIEGLADSLLSRAGEILGCRFRKMELHDLCDSAAFSALYDKHRSWDWRFGITPPFDAEFGIGEERIILHVEKGRVGPVRALPEGKTLYEGCGEVRFHLDEVIHAFRGAGEPRLSLIEEGIF